VNSVVFRGAEAVIRWGYHRAAELGSWTLQDHTLIAEVKSVDALKITQSSLTFVVPRPSGSWAWAVTGLQIAGRTLTASVGPPEGSHVSHPSS